MPRDNCYPTVAQRRVLRLLAMGRDLEIQRDYSLMTLVALLRNSWVRCQYEMDGDGDHMAHTHIVTERGRTHLMEKRR